jgi:NTP pyrophosphatase (non-canonical NTP hydrolase)
LENVSKKIQEAAKTNQFTEETAQMVVQLETVCQQACEELEIEFNLIKNTQS